MLLGGSVSPWRSGVEEGRSPLGRFRKPEPCFPRTYATWDAKKDENRFESMKFRVVRRAPRVRDGTQNSIPRNTGRIAVRALAAWLVRSAGPSPSGCPIVAPLGRRAWEFAPRAPAPVDSSR